MKRRKPKQIKALLGVGAAIINDNFENPASATKNLKGALFIGASCVKAPQYSDKNGSGTDNSINFLAVGSHLPQEKKWHIV